MNRTQCAYANKRFEMHLHRIGNVYAARRWWWLREHFIISKRRIKDCKVYFVGKTRQREEWHCNRKSWRKSVVDVDKITN